MVTDTPPAAGLLEPSHITVTDLDGDGGPGGYVVAKHNCRCWFCPECCGRMGRQLRDKLLPVLGTFKGLLLVTFTVDPTLFATPKAAYLYMRRRRCLARTIQDLWRGGYLKSRRYFYVVEWQKHTEQAHFHVLLDATFVPWSAILSSWSKHRPDTAGPVVGNRPAFGTVIISVPKFAGGPDHAAAYVTKYLTKTPAHGFPAWVLDLGAETRVRRYSASRDFWPNPTHRMTTGGTYKPHHRSYRTRIGSCGATVDVFEVRVKLDTSTGELQPVASWMGELDAAWGPLAAKIPPTGGAGRNRRRFTENNLERVLSAVVAAAGGPVGWRRGGPVKIDADPLPTYSAEAAWQREHTEYMRHFDDMIREWSN